MINLLTGDLCFQDIGCGAVCDAINGVTLGWGGAEINHCGLVVCSGVQNFIAEAIYPKVRLTPVNAFLDRARDAQGRPRIIVARLKAEYSYLLEPAEQYCHSVIGTPYDVSFGPDPAALYCSELIVDAFRAANAGQDFFPEQAMTFKDPVTGEILEYWKTYYQALGSEVPEGEIGSNPGSLSLSGKLTGHTQLGGLRGLSL